VELWCGISSARVESTPLIFSATFDVRSGITSTKFWEIDADGTKQICSVARSRKLCFGGIRVRSATVRSAKISGFLNEAYDRSKRWVRRVRWMRILKRVRNAMVPITRAF